MKRRWLEKRNSAGSGEKTAGGLGDAYGSIRRHSQSFGASYSSHNTMWDWPNWAKLAIIVDTGHWAL